MKQKIPLLPIAFALVLLSCLLGVFDRDLWTPDEPRDAAVALAMSRNGDWVVPRLAGEPFIEKPSLFFAMGGIMAKCVGGLTGNVAAIRLVSVLCGIGTMAVVFLMGRALLSARVGAMAALLLGTMPAFSRDLHWIRVDMALTFFVVTAIYLFMEMLRQNRWWLGLPAGLAVACSFLVKGVIGPILVAVGWLPVLVYFGVTAADRGVKATWQIPGHLAAAATCVAGSGLWVWRLLARQDAALWQAWFWDNHVGRTQGSTTHLGHLHTGIFWYYAITLLIFTMPWTPILLYTLWTWAKKAWRQRPAWKNIFSHPAMVFLGWGILGLVLLSIPATKRNVYFLPVLPAWAMLCAIGWKQAVDVRWLQNIYWAGGKVVTSLVLALLLLCSPIIMVLLSGPAREYLPSMWFSFSLHNTLPFLLLISLWAVWRTHKTNPLIWIVAVACFLNIFWLFFAKSIDAGKEMGSGYAAFAAQLPTEKAAFERIAGYNLTETGRGGLEFYGNLILPRITDDTRAIAILSGQDTEFNQLIVERGPRPDEWSVPVRTLGGHNIVNQDTRKRALYWIEGAR